MPDLKKNFFCSYERNVGFRDGAFRHSIEVVIVPIPLEPAEYYGLKSATPYLMSLPAMDHMGIYSKNISNEVITKSNGLWNTVTKCWGNHGLVSDLTPISSYSWPREPFFSSIDDLPIPHAKRPMNSWHQWEVILTLMFLRLLKRTVTTVTWKNRFLNGSTSKLAVISFSTTPCSLTFITMTENGALHHPQSNEI